MLQTTPETAKTLGADLRALRKARGITLQDMADALGRSVGWLVSGCITMTNTIFVFELVG